MKGIHGSRRARSSGKGNHFVMGGWKTSKFYELANTTSQMDTLMPEEFLETLRRKTPIQPEIRLMFAVLQDGLQCFQKYACSQKTRGKNLFQEAEQWITEEDDDFLFSFETICDTLGINPQYLRQELLRWREAQINQAQPSQWLRIRRRVQHGRRRAIARRNPSGGFQQRFTG